MSKGTESISYEVVKIGKVSAIDRQKCMARVYFEDRDDFVSSWMPVMQKNTMNHKFYWMPDVDEQVVCLFLPNGHETAIIIGSIYSEADKPVPEIAEEGKDRIGIWIDAGNYIKWIEEERTFEIKTENPVRWLT